MTIASVPGARIGPPAASVYALEPSGVATTTPSPPKRTKSWSSTQIETATWPAPSRTMTRSLSARCGRPGARPPGGQPARRASRRRGRGRARRRAPSALVAVSAPRLPQATPSTGLLAGAATRRAASVVPSPPSATTRSQSAASPAGATSRSCPGVRTCTTSTPCARGPVATASSAPSIGRRGCTTRPMRSIRVHGTPAGDAVHTVTARENQANSCRDRAFQHVAAARQAARDGGTAPSERDASSAARQGDWQAGHPPPCAGTSARWRVRCGPSSTKPHGPGGRRGPP